MTEDHREILQTLPERSLHAVQGHRQGRPAGVPQGRDALDQLATGEIFTAAAGQELGLSTRSASWRMPSTGRSNWPVSTRTKTRVVEYRRMAALLDFSWLGESLRGRIATGAAAGIEHATGVLPGHDHAGAIDPSRPAT